MSLHRAARSRRRRNEDKRPRELGRVRRKLTGEASAHGRIGITGKYAELRDAYASIEKSLEHCGAHLARRSTRTGSRRPT
jgi:CTP synthase (UTP-ammonia lyase)